MAMLTLILLLFTANCYSLVVTYHGQVWKSGFFWVSALGMSVILYAYGRALL